MLGDGGDGVTEGGVHWAVAEEAVAWPAVGSLVGVVEPGVSNEDDRCGFKKLEDLGGVDGGVGLSSG